MKVVSRNAPGDLPRAVRDLVAEGGNVLASDDAVVAESDARVIVIRRMRLNESVDRASARILMPSALRAASLPR